MGPGVVELDSEWWRVAFLKHKILTSGRASEVSHPLILWNALLSWVLAATCRFGTGWESLPLLLAPRPSAFRLLTPSWHFLDPSLGMSPHSEPSPLPFLTPIPFTPSWSLQAV